MQVRFEVSLEEYRKMIAENARLRQMLEAIERVYRSDRVMLEHELEIITGWKKGDVDVISTAE